MAGKLVRCEACGNVTTAHHEQVANPLKRAPGESVILYAFRWLLLFAAIVYTLAVLLTIFTAGTEYRQNGRWYVEVNASEQITSALLGWVIVMLVLGGLYALTEIAKQLQKRAKG